MKRSSSLVSGHERSPFQQSVSCQLCRTRKLKCDRGRPCFNCSSWTFDCVYLSDQRQPSQPPFQTAGPGINVSHSCERDCSALYERVRRLEAPIFGADEPELVRKVSTSARSIHQDEEQQRTSEWLEDLLTDPQGRASNPISVPTVTAQRTLPETLDLTTILHQFPTRSDAILLLKYFIETFDAMYRNLHVPTTWRLLKEMYEDLDVQRTPSATQLAFFLGIFAGSAYVSNSNLILECPASARTSPLALAELWHKQAVFLLTKPPVPPSTQALISLMTLAHLCTQIEGFSGSFGILAMSGLQMARTMRIHRLDSHHFREERRKNGADMVDVELKRRVWWHMVASDWLLSNVGGPHEGTYMLHPSQIETFHPSNAEDCDIPTGITHITEEAYSKPLSTPTTITYFLWRLQVATLSREVTDLLTPTFCTSPDIDNSDEMYNKVLLLDRKYQDLLKSLPPFFQLTNRMDPMEYSLLLKEKPYLNPQRYLINFILHTNLARLHRRFLIRGSTQPKFAYSRMQCIQSAETVLEVRALVVGNESVGSFTYFLLAHFFMAAVILAMDVCFNPNEIRVEQRKQDVLRACRVLEEELGAKMEPDESGEEESNGRVMLRAFQKAVLNLRALLRRMNRKEKRKVEIIPDFMEARHEVSPNIPFAKGTFTKTDRQMRSPQHTATNTEKYSTKPDTSATNQTTPQEQAIISIPPGDEPHLSSDFAVDNMWDEFFTVGSDFNSTDWDTFLIDLDEQMAAMGSGT